MNNPYDKTQINCKYGHFNPDKKAGYTITNAKELVTPWYYVYNNRKILLYVDQNGPVKVQYQPPSGILVIKRELGETQSKWQTWVQEKDLNGGIPVSNFNNPKLNCNGKEPKFTINYTPTKATYISEYINTTVKTEIFVPFDRATVCMKTTIENKDDKTREFTVTPSLFPYINVPQMVAWDLPEWYLSSRAFNCEKTLTFAGQMSDPLMIKQNERSVTFNVDFDDSAEYELDMCKFALSGNFLTPESVIQDKKYSYKMGENASFGEHQAVYAARYKVTLNKGESKTFTQVLTIQQSLTYDDSENDYDCKYYFDDFNYAQRIKETDNFYDQLFSKRAINTKNEIFNNFINYFTPLQMFWVGSLDRGWPSRMRGVRDASQDYVGILHLNSELTKNAMIEMMEHQQKDGWFPRQISTESRTAPHDMRYYVDGGAFFLELAHEYLVFTRDKDFLNKKVVWLDDDEESTVLEHLFKAIYFYLDKHNIGEHGLCKVWYGDWWDPMDKIGMDGRGETVTVTAQIILDLKNFIKMLKWLNETEYQNTIKELESARDNFITAMRENAFNKLGYFNGYFNDNGKWLLCEKDPDGEQRMYLVSNAWAIISGAATPEMAKSVIANANSMCFGRMGYNTNSKGYPVYIDKAGRVGNGNSPGTGPYNHAQSFLVRAACVCGDAGTAYKATRYIFPIEEKYAPVEKTFAPPYAIANGYSNSDASLHRVELQFLSGTVSYVLRNVYNYFCGITFDYDGLIINPCVPKEFGDFDVKFSYLNKKFILKFTNTGKPKFVFNGKSWTKSKFLAESNRKAAFFADNDFNENNLIEIDY